jgi:hypothetical protein
LANTQHDKWLTLRISSDRLTKRKIIN